MIRRTLVALVAAIASLVATALPAAAHGGPGGTDPPSSNFRSSVQGVDPPAPGLSVRTIDAGARVELVNRTEHTVTVLGYDGEPYLRIGPDGVFENRRSPATYLNRDRQGRAEVPEEADAQAEPEWRRIDNGPSARWHDHRAHWMGSELPPQVAADPDRTHVVIEQWEIPLLVGDRSSTVAGGLTWIPGPDGWPWAGAGVALVAALAVIGRTRWWRWTIVGAAGLLLSASVLDVIGVWWATGEPTLAKAGELAAPLLAGTVLVGALPQLWRAPRDAVLLAGSAAAGFGLLFGVTGLDWLTRSQLPTGLDPTLARWTVLISCAGAVGLLAVVGTRFPELAASVPPRARTSSPRPMAVAVPAELRRDRVILLAGLAVVAVLFALTASGDPAPTPSPTEEAP